ncbi:MAG: transglutaminase-like domain-containing protein [Syntrophales bacterium]
MKEKRGKIYFRLMLAILVLLFYLLTPLACAPTKVKIYPEETRTEKPSPAKPFSGKTYIETISEWKSYQDLVKWMEREFSFDAERYKKFEGTLPVPRTPEETFQLKSGIYIDAAEFSKKTLNQINPSYKAQTAIIVVRPNVFNHYVCAFKKNGNLFILDYGTPYKEITGVHGPYNSLDEYGRFYEKHHPMRGKIEAITYLP